MRYPEAAAGGFTRVDGLVAFHSRVQAIATELGAERPIRIVDFGAGRGAQAEDPVPFRRQLQDLRAPGRQVVGVDVDDAVLANPTVDEAHVLALPELRMPLEDESVDLVVSRFTFEHVTDPGLVARELDRVVRPGGWMCAMTPNKWGYIALGARVVPNRFHVGALRRLQPDKAERDTFPTAYRLNDRRAFDVHFPAPRFAVHAYTADSEPYLYAGGSKGLAAAIGVLHHVPAPLRSMWYVFIRKDQ